ncbi:MAG: hypothetical protein NC311_04605 [Muribaculaceae bacterium]|nr:hypothetical protein [Muribaculaceae bacterium]
MRKFASIILKIIGYLAFFCGGVGGINLAIHGMFDPIYSTIGLIAFILIGILCLTIGKKLQQGKNSVAEVKLTIEKNSKEAVLHKIQWKKIGISIFIVCVCTTLWGCIIGLNYEYNAIFYVPFFLIVMVWYLYLLWRKTPSEDEDYLLLPLLQKIGLFNSFPNKYELRKALLKTFVPVYAGTIVISTIVVILNDILAPYDDRGYDGYWIHHEITLGSWLLAIPIMTWVVFFIYSYGSQWINKVKQLEDNIHG